MAGGGGVVKPVNNSNSVQTVQNLFVSGNIGATGGSSTISCNNLTTNGTMNVGNRILGTAIASDNFWIGLQGSGTEPQRIGIGLVGESPTGAVKGISFYSNGSPAALINSSGNFGVGTANPNFKLDINGDSNASGNICNKGFSIIRKPIGYKSITNTGPYVYASSVLGWQNTFSTTYTRVSNDSTIEIECDVNLSLIVGAVGVASYAAVVSRIYTTNPNSAESWSDTSRMWLRSDNGLIESSSPKKIIFRLVGESGFIAAGQVLTITIQVMINDIVGTITGFGVSRWSERNFLTVTEYI